MRAIRLTVNDMNEQAPLPAGREFAGFRFTIRAPSGAQADSGLVTVTTFDFSNPGPGRYLGSVEAVDTLGESLMPGGSPVTCEVVVSEDGTVRFFPLPTSLMGMVVEVGTQGT